MCLRGWCPLVWIVSRSEKPEVLKFSDVFNIFFFEKDEISSFHLVWVSISRLSIICSFLIS